MTLTTRKASPKTSFKSIYIPDPRVGSIVSEVVGQLADKWTMIIVVVLKQHGELRFSQVGKLAGGISQKMLTQTLRQLERSGLVIRTVHAVVPPKVEYRLTDLGFSVAESFCGIWRWAESNLQQVIDARESFDAKAQGEPVQATTLLA